MIFSDCIRLLDNTAAGKFVPNPSSKSGKQGKNSITPDNDSRCSPAYLQKLGHLVVTLW